MENNNVWKNFKFSERSEKSAYDYLKEQKNFLEGQSKGELSMQIETSDGYTTDQESKLVTFYVLFVVAPRLGNFRKKLLTVIEGADSGRFPVEIVSHMEGGAVRRDVQESKFIETVEEILSRQAVRRSVENLYRQSLESRAGDNQQKSII